MITFLGDVALISNELTSEYKPNNPYIFNCEYVIGNKEELKPVTGKINLCSEKYNFSEIFGRNPVAVSVVNNHIYDYGEIGFQSTVTRLKNSGIGIISQNPYYLNDNICLLSYMSFGETNEVAFDSEKVKKEINRIKEKNESVKVIIQIHWGIENHPSINENQRKVGHLLIDMGADLVIGHHPHCIQPIELYKGKYICYSLGNGLFGNINQPSHYDDNGVPKRIYRFKWQSWNRKSLAINYDEITGNITIDELYQKANTLFCKNKNVRIEKYGDLKKNRKLTYIFRKYFLFAASNAFVDGKLFDMQAVKMEMSK
ncbi:MAG: CapA family protein [Clostridia bacterium]|nr:CapA family protein [Oscillospiraceae bacterium]MBQ2828272.1 CapA family protein [Clostridia bacterium]